MPGDPYVRETQRRAARYEKRLFLVCLVVVVAFFVGISIQSCGSDEQSENDTPCQLGVTCE